MRESRGRSPRSRRENPGGFTAVEVLVALTLGLLLTGGAWSLLLFQTRTSTEAVSAADRLDAIRIVRGVLGSELRAGRQGRDWAVLGSDSLRLRAFRGVALGCGAPATRDVRVRFRGARRPEPEKDSVLVLRSDGSWRAVDLVAAAPAEDSVAGTCTPGAIGGALERWTLDEAVEGFVVGRLFERGSYHLADGAFRYRSGRGGRQPLIPELLDGGSEWGVSPSGTALHLRVAFSPMPGGASARERAVTLWFHHP